MLVYTKDIVKMAKQEFLLNKRTKCLLAEVPLPRILEIFNNCVVWLLTQ